MPIYDASSVGIGTCPNINKEKVQTNNHFFEFILLTDRQAGRQTDECWCHANSSLGKGKKLQNYKNSRAFSAKQHSARTQNEKDILRHEICIVLAFDHLGLQGALIRVFRLAAPYLPISLRYLLCVFSFLCCCAVDEGWRCTQRNPKMISDRNVETCFTVSI